MSTPDLLQAINRLEEAVSRAEAAFNSKTSAKSDQVQSKDHAIREAMTEVDRLIVSITGKPHG